MNTLIIGATADDISYIVNKMNLISQEKIADQDVYIGTYGNKEVVVLASGLGEMMASMITGIAIERYKPYICINIGNVNSFSDNLKQTDLFIATRIYLASVNQMAIGRISYGQIPGMKPFFSSDETLVNQMKDINSSLSNLPLIRGILISDDSFRTDPQEMNDMVDDHYTRLENMSACDSSSGGVAVACSKFGIPYLCIKVCAYELGDRMQLITRTRMGLSVQPYVGKMIQKFLETSNQIQI